MISPQYFVESLKALQMDFFTGVPDSLLKNVCAYIGDNICSTHNIIAANEGAAIGLAAGYYLSTKKIPVVYMQNSGIGNAINPLMSLTDKEVYNIPLLLLIGWRGESSIKDEPQHIKQGKVTIPLLESMGIKYAIMSQSETELATQLQFAQDYMNTTKESFAFVIRKGTFDYYNFSQKNSADWCLSREVAIQIVASTLNKKDIIVSTTGMISRELFEYRETMCQGHERDFLTVGSMGHASQIALSIALQNRQKRIYCFDGDGSVLMHMGSLAIIGTMHPNNYIHVIFNNGAHDSVGGQPTVGLNINFPKIAEGCGYEYVFSVSDKKSLCEILNQMKKMQGPILLEIKVKKGARKDLGRPTTTPIQNKEVLMDYLNME